MPRRWPERAGVADITAQWAGEGNLYVCASEDVCFNRIVGYSIDSRMKSWIAVAALNNAVARRGGVAGCVVHTDRGSQGGFKRSSQHLAREVFSASSSEGRGSNGSPEVEVAWSSEIPTPFEVEFWEQIGKGLLPEEASRVAGVAQEVGARRSPSAKRSRCSRRRTRAYAILPACWS